MPSSTKSSFFMAIFFIIEQYCHTCYHVFQVLGCGYLWLKAFSFGAKPTVTKLAKC